MISIIADNQLQTIPISIGKLDQLVILNISRNQLKSLPASFNQLKKLKALWLAENNLEALPDAVWHLVGTEGFKYELKGNPVQNLPTRLDSLSIDELEYFEELWDEQFSVLIDSLESMDNASWSDSLSIYQQYPQNSLLA
jgi:hypothetical protein